MKRSPSVFWWIALLAIGMGCGEPRLWAQDLAENRASLKGLQPVSVEVASLPDAERTGSLVFADVTAQLRQSNIPVGPSTAILQVAVSSVKSATADACAYEVTVSVMQHVSVLVNRVAIPATTWSTHRTGIATRTQLLGEVRRTAAGLIDRFARAYLEVNPSIAQGRR